MGQGRHRIVPCALLNFSLVGQTGTEQIGTSEQELRNGLSV